MLMFNLYLCLTQIVWTQVHISCLSPCLVIYISMADPFKKNRSVNPLQVWFLDQSELRSIWAVHTSVLVFLSNFSTNPLLYHTIYQKMINKEKGLNTLEFWIYKIGKFSLQWLIQQLSDQNKTGVYTFCNFCLKKSIYFYYLYYKILYHFLYIKE